MALNALLCISSEITNFPEHRLLSFFPSSVENYALWCGETFAPLLILPGKKLTLPISMPKWSPAVSLLCSYLDNATGKGFPVIAGRQLLTVHRVNTLLLGRVHWKGHDLLLTWTLHTYKWIFQQQKWQKLSAYKRAEEFCVVKFKLSFTLVINNDTIC